MVNTFLPYEDFQHSAQALDYRRLGKQRVEALQILKANLGMTKGWVNHPAAKMWKGYEAALCVYGITMCNEWVKRGYKDTCTNQFMEILQEVTKNTNSPLAMPKWIRDQSLINSHRSNLLRKDYTYYSQFEWDVEDDLPYVWPTNDPPQPTIERQIVKEID